MLLTIAQLLAAIAAAAATVSNSTVARWAALASSLTQHGESARAALEELTTQIRTMVAEGREPTPDEWDELEARSQAAHAAIQDWNPGDPAEE